MITDAILEEFGRDVKNLKELSPKQNKALQDNFTDNLRTSGIQYDENYHCIMFRNRSTWKNWLYYAGFEYIDEGDYLLFSGYDEFLIVLERGMHDRIDQVLDLLEKNEPLEE